MIARTAVKRAYPSPIHLLIRGLIDISRMPANTTSLLPPVAV